MSGTDGAPPDADADWVLAVGQVEQDWLAGRLVASLGREGAWLLLSIQRYHWRARADMARSLVHHLAGMGTHAPIERWSVADLQCKTWHVEAAEMFARLIVAMKAHHDGADFFDAYSRAVDAREFVTAAARIDAAEAAAILGYHGDCRFSPELSAQPEFAVRQRAFELCEDVADAVRDIQGLLAWSERPTPSGPILKRALRDITNRFRHGTLVLYPSCAVDGWESHVIGGEEAPNGSGVLVYLGEGKRPGEAQQKKPVVDRSIMQWSWVVQGMPSAFNELRLLEELGELTYRLAGACISSVARPDEPLLWPYIELSGGATG